MKIEYAGSLEDNKRLAQELASVDSLAGLRTRLLAQDPELTSGQLEELSLKWKAVGILHLFGRQAGKTIPVVYLWIIIYQRPADQERIAKPLAVLQVADQIIKKELERKYWNALK